MCVMTDDAGNTEQQPDDPGDFFGRRRRFHMIFFEQGRATLPTLAGTAHNAFIDRLFGGADQKRQEPRKSELREHNIVLLSCRGGIKYCGK